MCVCLHQLENSFHTTVIKKRNTFHLRTFSPSNSFNNGLIYIIDTFMLYIEKFLSFIQYHLRILMLHILNDSNQRTYKQYEDFPCSSAGKESTCSAGDPSSIPGSGSSPGEGIGYPLQCSDLENSMDCIVHRVAKSRTQLSDFHFTSRVRRYR